MIFRPLVIQYSNYLTEFKKSIKQYYGLTSLRNLLFIKPDRKLYYQDNLETEFCLSHPDWSEIQNPPEEFPPEGHAHPNIDADTLDGQHGSFYQNAGNLSSGTIPLARIPTPLTGKDADTLDGQHGSFYQNAGNLSSGTIPLARIPDTLTGKDADTLDTYHASALAKLTGAVFTGDIQTHRNNSSGVIYLGNTGQKYLFFDGTNYQMPGADVYANGFQLRAKGVVVVRSTAVTIPYNTHQVISYAGGVQYMSDGGAWWDTDSAIYASEAGWFMAIAQISFSSAGTAQDLLLRIHINGTPVSGCELWIQRAPNGASLSLCQPIYMANSNYIQASVFQITQSPNTVTNVGDASRYAKLGLVRMG